jgi:diacylglycerol kinase (ATP)
VTTSASPVGLISNPASGHNRDQFERIHTRIAKCPAIHHLVTHSEAEVGPALAELAKRQIGILAINGGDGTAANILGEMLESECFPVLPLIVLLPGGTANMNAGDIGVSGSLWKATERFCRWCEGERQTEGLLEQRALMRVMLAGENKPHYGMFLGGGAIIQGTEYAHAEVHARGLRDDFSLALTTLRTVWGLVRNDPDFNQHVTIQLALDEGETATHHTLILVVSTLRRLAFGMRPFWGTGSGRVRVTLFAQGCSRFTRTFISIIRGRPSRNAVPESGYFSHNADEIRLQLDGKLNLDGEILVTKGQVDISASPSLDFLKL